MSKDAPLAYVTIEAEFELDSSGLDEVTDSIRQALEILREQGSAKAKVKVIGNTEFTVE